MKTLLSLVFVAVAAISFGQLDYNFKMGSEPIKFSGHQLVFDNGGEETYYNIENGTLTYHYINIYEGVIIQYASYSCSVKSMDTKTAYVKDYEEGLQFLYMNAKKLENVVKHITWDLRDGKVVKNEEDANELTLIVPSKEKADEITEQIKKGKGI